MTDHQDAGVPEEVMQLLNNLACSLHAKHFSEVRDWMPLDTAIGLISQIDNMTCGLRRADIHPRSEGGETVCVPREPTEAMLIDGAARLRDFYSEDPPFCRTKAMYRAMIAASGDATGGKDGADE